MQYMRVMCVDSDRCLSRNLEDINAAASHILRFQPMSDIPFPARITVEISNPMAFQYFPEGSTVPAFSVSGATFRLVLH